MCYRFVCTQSRGGRAARGDEPPRARSFLSCPPVGRLPTISREFKRRRCYRYNRMPEKSGESFTNKIKLNEKAKKAFEESGLIPSEGPTDAVKNDAPKAEKEGGSKKPKKEKKTKKVKEAKGAVSPVSEESAPPAAENTELEGSGKKEDTSKPLQKKERLLDVLSERDKKHLERIYKDMNPEEVEQFQKSLEELDTRRIRMQIKDRLIEALGSDPVSLSKEELAERIRASGVKDFETVARRLYGIKNPNIEQFRKEVLAGLGLEYNRVLFGDRRKRELAKEEAQRKHLPEDLVRAEEGIKFAYQEYFENVLKNFNEKGALSVDPEIYKKMGAIDAEAAAMFGKKRLQEMREEIARERGFHYETLEEMLEAQKANVREPVFVKPPEGMRSPEETAALADSWLKREQENREFMYVHGKRAELNDVDYQLKEREQANYNINKGMKNQEAPSPSSSEAAPPKKAKRETKKAREARLAAAADRDIEEAYDSIREAGKSEQEKKKKESEAGALDEMAELINERIPSWGSEDETAKENFAKASSEPRLEDLTPEERSEAFNRRLAEEALKDEPLYEKEAAGEKTTAPAEGTPEYAEAKRNLDSAKENYQRILNDKNSDPLTKKDALRRYLEARNEFVGGDVSRYVSEMLDDLKEKTKRKEGVWEHALGFSKKLGEMNLSKTNWEWVKKLEEWGKVPERKLKLWGNKTLTIGGWSLGERIAKAANMRTAIGGVLLGLSLPAAAVAGTWGAAGALGLRAAFRGAGAMMSSYEALRQGQQMLTGVKESDLEVTNVGSRTVTYEKGGDVKTEIVPDWEVSKMSAAEVEEKLLGLIARARMNASWDQYKKPIELLAKRYQDNLESAIAAGYDLKIAGKSDVETLSRENSDPKKINKIYEERREEVFGEKKKQAFKEEAAMRGVAGAVGVVSAAASLRGTGLWGWLKNKIGGGEVISPATPVGGAPEQFDFPQDKASQAEADWVRRVYGEVRPDSGTMTPEESTEMPDEAFPRRAPSPRVTDFSRVFSDERIAIDDWDRLREDEGMLDHERNATMMEHSSVDLDAEDMLDHEDASSRQAQLVPREAEPESPSEAGPETKRVLSRRELIGSSGLRPEYYELVKDMSVEEYLEKKGMPLNPKNGFPVPKVDGEYPWISQDRLAHNRWMDYERLKERMQEVIKSMPPDDKINALKGMTVEEFIKGHLAK